MNEVRTELLIPAPIDDVWRVLVDFAGYADWNPVMEYTEVDCAHTKVKAAKGTRFERDFDGEVTSTEPHVLAQTREVLIAEFDAFNQALLRRLAGAASLRSR